MPEPLSEPASGVGLVRSTDDAVEVNETRRGKGPARKDPGRARGRPDTEPGHPPIRSRTGERDGLRGRPDSVHRPAASCRRRSARTGVPASEAAGECGSRRDHGGRLRARPGEQSPGPLREGPYRALPTLSGSARLHPEVRRGAQASRHTVPGGQDRPGRGRRGAERRLRGRLPRFRQRMHQPLALQHRWLASVLRGHYGYFGMPHNWRSLNAFWQDVRRIWFKCLQRRSQKNRRRGGDWFDEVTARLPLPLPRITHPWTPRRA